MHLVAHARGWLLFALLAALPMKGTAWASPEFMNVTEASGIDFRGTLGTPVEGIDGMPGVMYRNTGNGAAVVDIDGDGDLDVYLLGQLGLPNRLYRNNLDQGSKTFTDITAEPLNDLGMSRVAAFVDLDNDLDRDLVLVNDDGYLTDGPELESVSKIFENTGNGSFAPGVPFSLTAYLHSGLSLTDYNRDGLIDFYVSNWCMYGAFGPCKFPGFNQMFRNQGGLQVADATKASGIGVLDQDSFSTIFADFNHDQYPEVYIATDFADDYFYRNDNGKYVDVSGETSVTHFGNDMGATCADFDDDGDLDMFVTNITDTDGLFGASQNNVFYVNQEAQTDTLRFVNQAVARGVANTHWGWGVEFVDVENDGDLDIAVATGFDEMVSILAPGGSSLFQTPSVLLVNDGTGHFTRVTDAGLEETYDSRTLIAFDYDRDGDQDFLITNVNQPVALLENVTNNNNHWLEVILSPDNKAIGAAVFADFQGKKKRRDVICGDSFLAGTPTEVHFGLGSATVIDRLVIRWADGTETERHNVPADQVLNIDHGDAPTPVTLLNFTASRTGADVLLQWEVAGLSDHAGFHVYRQDADGDRARISNRLLEPTLQYEFVDSGAPTGNVSYWLQEVSRTGGIIWHGPRTVSEQPLTPTVGLASIFPNPFHQTTTIQFILSGTEPATLKILDLNGRIVRTFVGSGRDSGESQHAVTWSGEDDGGRRLAAGIYFLRYESATTVQARKIVFTP